MKIICVVSPHNQAKYQYQEPIIFMKPDTSILRSGKPFYIPNFSSDIQYEAEVVIRIHKLGKNIAEKFASRYFNEITIGINMTIRNLQNNLVKNRLPWDLCKSFDYSAIIGTFVEMKELNFDINHLPFHLKVNQKTMQSGNTEEMQFKINEIISYISRFITLKTGDLIFCGSQQPTTKIIQINDHLEGYIDNKILLDFRIK